jgi:hypothetical protein
MTESIHATHCPVCQSDKLEWGILNANYRRGLGLLGGGTWAIKVQRCLRCDHVILYTDDAITRRNQLLDFVGLLLRLVIPVAVLILLFKPFMTLLRGLQNFSRQTTQMKQQIDSLSQQLDAVSNRFSFPFLMPAPRPSAHQQNGNGNGNGATKSHKPTEKDSAA